jgi:hypothetical protein
MGCSSSKNKNTKPNGNSNIEFLEVKEIDTLSEFTNDVKVESTFKSDNTTLLNINPGFVIKTKEQGKLNKVLINVFHHESIRVDTSVCLFSRDSVDRKGVKCVVYWCLVHSAAILLADSSLEAKIEASYRILCHIIV